MTILDSQLDYYRARACEYDEWFTRQGRYDRGQAANQRWHDDVAVARAALAAFRPEGDVLELACGTGLWTRELARHANSVLAVDGASEMLAINKARLEQSNVTYLQANIFQWTPQHEFDVVFFSFWLSHVPQENFRPFWDLVSSALKPNGRVFLIDSLPHPESSATNHPIADASADVQQRILNNGQRFEIVKRYFNPNELQTTLSSFGWNARIRTTENFFLYGAVSAAANGA